MSLPVLRLYTKGNLYVSLKENTKFVNDLLLRVTMNGCIDLDIPS